MGSNPHGRILYDQPSMIVHSKNFGVNRGRQGGRTGGLCRRSSGDKDRPVLRLYMKQPPRVSLRRSTFPIRMR
jgi:hypothetical protein